MSVFPFQSNAHHTRNIRRAFTERRSNELQKHLGVDHIPCLHHSKSSEARLDQLAQEKDELNQGQHHRYLIHQQHSKSENSVAQIKKSPSNENIVTAFTRPEAWKLTFGSQDGGFKFDALTIASNGKLNKR
jgi:hypothetical protein